ncbi:MAG: RagB/SusD family nutrient uptake outer membrane protein [Cytophagaceae bacterium]|nr:RagB/SusD family nutrient uptake outer membrane protein [Cytophagaceae bacterium]
MKTRLFLSLLALMLFGTSCEKQLLEDVRTQVTDSYLNTAAGFQEAVNASYGSLKPVFCAIEDNGIIPNLTVFGTDTYTNGFDGAYKMMNFYNADLNPRTPALTRNWNNLYVAINTCNAVISRAPQVTGLTDAVKNTRVAEVRFIRAQYYFMLVQLFGPVHLTLTETTGVQAAATRAPVKDVYEAIIKDLDFAIQTLPATATPYGRVTKPAAENALALVYLTRATSEAKQADDYAKAAELAKGVISKYNFKLLDEFGSVFLQGSAEKNSEVIWAIQNNKDVISNGPGNTMHLYFIMKYDDLPGLQRDIANGRPYARYKPTDFVLNTLFNRAVDSRYTKSFKRVFYCNKPGTYAIAGRPVTLATGDTAVYLADREYTAAELSRTKYSVYPPSRQTERVFPTLTKFLDPERQGINDQPGSRDLLYFRLAETYLIAAEALLMTGNKAEAATLVNVVRRRAAKAGATSSETTANRTAMEVTPDQLDLDFMLDERARELLGEGNRWFDLVRTGKLLERVKKYNPFAAANIKPFHVLRPIPQEQIDRTEGGLPQNPGY